MQNTKRQIKTIKIDDNLNIPYYFRGRSLLTANAVDSFDILLLDMSAVDSLDTSGIGSLLALYEQMAGKGKEVALVSSSRACAKILNLLGLDKIFWIYASMDAARTELTAIATSGILDMDAPPVEMISPLKFEVNRLKALSVSVG